MSNNYLSGKEIRAIAKENKKIMKRLEAQKYRKCDESEYLTQMADSENILEIDNLHSYFFTEQGVVKAVNGVSFTVPKNSTVGVVGESGCGKTTLGRTILKLHKADGGQIIFDGKDITELKSNEMREIRKKMQIIFQDPYSSLPPRSTVGGILSEPVEVHKIVPKSEIKPYVLDLMEKCGLRDYYYERYPHEFSGGQRQRICIARALSVNPELVICDEPVSALDVSIQAQIINLLKSFSKSLTLPMCSFLTICLLLSLFQTKSALCT